MLSYRTARFYQKTRKTILQLLSRKEGPTAAEYGVMLCLVIGGLIAVIVAFKSGILVLLTKASNALINMSK